jgi:hypothetical protein
MSLRIRPEQLEAFQPVAEAGFARRLTEYIHKAHADAMVRLPSGAISVNRLSNALLARMVLNGIARGRGYGISWESSLAAFVVIMFVAAPNFDQHPLIQRALLDDTSEPDRRIEGLWRRISSQNWRAVEAYYDPGAWALADKQE